MASYFSFSNISAGFLAVMIGFAGSGAIVFQAATAAGATGPELGSWLLSLGLGSAISCALLALYYRMPIVTAWSTPGAALLVANLPGVHLSEAIGAFIFCGFLTFLAGATGLFARLIQHIPRSVAAAMLSGVLLHFGLDLFVVMNDQFLLVLGMFLFYLLGKRFFPRFNIFLVLLTGVLIAAFQGLIQPKESTLAFAHLVFVKPHFSWITLISVGLPLFVVTMTSQMLPGFAVLQNDGYQPPISGITATCGFFTMLAAPFGGFTINLSAMTAAICTGPQAEPNAAIRYRTALCAGFFYLMMGLFGATLAVTLTELPKEFIAAIAGLSLISTLANNLKIAIGDDHYREPALITFLVAASGVHLFHISAAFWALLAGLLAMLFSPRPLAVKVL